MSDPAAAYVLLHSQTYMYHNGHHINVMWITSDVDSYCLIKYMYWKVNLCNVLISLRSDARSFLCFFKIIAFIYIGSRGPLSVPP